MIFWQNIGVQSHGGAGKTLKKTYGHETHKTKAIEDLSKKKKKQNPIAGCNMLSRQISQLRYLKCILFFLAH